MHGGGEDAIIQRWKEIADADPRWRAEVAAIALIYAQAVAHGGAWKKALEEWNMIQSKQVNEWLAQDRAECLCEVLKDKFGPAPDELLLKVQATEDLARLSHWLRLAAKSATLDDFRRDAGL